MDARALRDVEADLVDPSPAGTVSRMAARPSPRVWRLRDPGLAALALLPLVLLALNSNWIYSGPHRDAWIYYGYFQNAVFYLKQFPDLYYGSRLAVILPGFLVHHLLPPVAANVVLHLALYWSAVLSFYLAVKELFGARVALLAGLALGCHPYFLQAAGWNYVDGFGIAYFLMALLLLTWAAASPSWRPLLLAGGAMATAIVSTNVFYAIYLPLLGAHFLVLNRQRGRIPLAAAILWAGLGAFGLFTLFGSFAWWVSGSFFYLRPSIQFLTGTLGTANPFRDATYSWLPGAVWLVFPVVTLFGSATLLTRARTDPSLRQNRALLWSQLQLALLFLAMLLLQVAGGTAALQYFYSVSLVIPSAFLAFAGQLASMGESLPRRRFATFAAMAAIIALLQIAPLCMPLIRALSFRVAPFPVLLAFLVGLGAAVAVGRRSPRPQAILGLFVALALSQLLVRQGGTIFWGFLRHGDDGRGLYEQLSHAVTSIDTFDPSETVRLWYRLDTDQGGIYDAVASAFLLCPRMIGLGFPDPEGGRMCDGVQLRPGVAVAILSADPAALEKAEAALQDLRLSARLLRREEIAGPSHDFAITYLRTEPRAAP
jgi:dolichyl-phosphate-mannose-protein mannosyltransferase